MMKTNSNVKGYFAAKEVLTYIKNEMLTHSRHTKLLVVLKGSKYVNFQHAICFIRKDFNKLKQLLMMDCKNSGPCVYHTFHKDQLGYTEEDKVDAKKDLYDNVYYAADIYTLRERPVEGEEKRILENRMNWVLTGEEKYWQDSKAIGREICVEKNMEAAQLRMQGKKTGKRRNKRSHFDTRKNKTMTEKRRALSNTKSDTMMDLDHNPDEASDNPDEEAGDVEMEGEDADGKYK